MMLKAVITAAGIGTRMLPATKEIPKEMLPIIVYKEDHWTLRPTLQAIFESLYDVGIRDFCFVVNRFKRVIENHFSPDFEFVNYLRKRGKAYEANDLDEFYHKVMDSTIVYVNQYEPLGFGHAVLITKSFIGNSSFIVHAGDDFIISSNNNHLRRLIETYKEKKADAAILVERVKDPRKYGVVDGEFVEHDTIEINNILEKPEKPPTNLAIIAVYIFNNKIFDALIKTGYDNSGELPLSIAIDHIVKTGGKVYGVLLQDREKRIDVGNPESYIYGLNLAYKEKKNENLD